MKQMKIQDKPEIYLLEHKVGFYFGSRAFLIDLSAIISTQQRIVVIAHKDLNPASFGDKIGKRFNKLGISPDHIGRIICLDGDTIVEGLPKIERSLYPGMKLYVLVSEDYLLNTMKYVHNTENGRYVKIISSIQCKKDGDIIDSIERRNNKKVPVTILTNLGVSSYVCDSDRHMYEYGTWDRIYENDYTGTMDIISHMQNIL